MTSRCVRSSVGLGFDSVESLFFVVFSLGGAGIMARSWEKCRGLFNLCVHSSLLGKDKKTKKKFKGEKEKTKRMRREKGGTN